MFVDVTPAFPNVIVPLERSWSSAPLFPSAASEPGYVTVYETETLSNPEARWSFTGIVISGVPSSAVASCPVDEELLK